jgi:hypothetical protein
MHARYGIPPLLAMLLFLGMTAPTQAADELTPYDFVVIDLDVREVTLEDMIARIRRLQGDSRSHGLKAAVNTITEQQVGEVYAAYGTSPVAHAAYGTRNAEAIAAWLDAHPEWQRRYEALRVQFIQLENTLARLLGGR